MRGLTGGPEPAPWVDTRGLFCVYHWLIVVSTTISHSTLYQEITQPEKGANHLSCNRRTDSHVSDAPIVVGVH